MMSDGKERLVGAFVLEEGKVVIRATDPLDSAALQRILSSPVTPDGHVAHAINPDTDPEAWLRAIPMQYTGSYLRVRLIDNFPASDQNKPGRFAPAAAGVDLTLLPTLPKDFQWFPLTKFSAAEMSHLPLHNEEFRKWSRHEIRTRLELLINELLPDLQRASVPEVKPLWQARDEKDPLPGGISRLAVYESFFGSDRIRVEGFRGCFTIAHGSDRVRIAQEMGWHYIPAQVVEVH